MGSSKVIDLPLNLVAPETVKKMNTKMKAAPATPRASLVKAANYSSYKCFLTYSTITKTFMIQKTQ